MNSFSSHISSCHVWEYHSQPRAPAALQYHHPLCCSLCPQRGSWMLSRSHRFPALRFTKYQMLLLSAQLNHSSLPWYLLPQLLRLLPTWHPVPTCFLPFQPVWITAAEIIFLVWESGNILPFLPRSISFYCMESSAPTQHTTSSRSTCMFLALQWSLPCILDFISYCCPLLLH